MRKDPWSARYEGVLINVAKDGRYGFIPREEVRLCFGESGHLPEMDVFCHAGHVEHIDSLANGFRISFKIVEDMRHPGKLKAIDARFHPRAVGVLSLVHETKKYGFVKAYDIEVAPQHFDAFSAGPPDDVFSKGDTFVHVANSAEGLQVIEDGMKISFLQVRSTSPRNFGKLQAVDVRIFS